MVVVLLLALFWLLVVLVLSWRRVVVDGCSVVGEEGIGIRITAEKVPLRLEEVVSELPGRSVMVACAIF